MTDEEAMRQLAKECPCRILGWLHAKGGYFHCTSARFPGKVLCFQKGSELPGDVTPTAAQAHFGQANGQSAKGATG